MPHSSTCSFEYSNIYSNFPIQFLGTHGGPGGGMLTCNTWGHCPFWEWAMHRMHVRWWKSKIFHLSTCHLIRKLRRGSIRPHSLTEQMSCCETFQWPNIRLLQSWFEYSNHSLTTLQQTIRTPFPAQTYPQAARNHGHGWTPIPVPQSPSWIEYWDSNTGWTWYSATNFCLLSFGSAATLLTCYANSVRFLPAQTEAKYCQNSLFQSPVVTL